ncbi:hypothetical protein NBRC116599_30580 [Aquicoccus sp. SU-CL01552]
MSPARTGCADAPSSRATTLSSPCLHTVIPAQAGIPPGPRIAAFAAMTGEPGPLTPPRVIMRRYAVIPAKAGTSQSMSRCDDGSPVRATDPPISYPLDPNNR